MPEVYCTTLVVTVSQEKLYTIHFHSQLEESLRHPVTTLYDDRTYHVVGLDLPGCMLTEAWPYV